MSFPSNMCMFDGLFRMTVMFLVLYLPYYTGSFLVWVITKVKSYTG